MSQCIHGLEREYCEYCRENDPGQWSSANAEGKPREPKPGDYGIPAHELDSLRRAKESFARTMRWFELTVSIGSFLGIGVVLIGLGFGFVQVSGAPPMLLCGVLLALVIPNVLGGWVRSVRDAIATHTFKNLNQYERRRLQYEESLYAYNEAQRRKQRDFWLSLDGARFELEVQGLFQRAGYLVLHTGGSGDGGIDLELRQRDKKIIVQCKAHKNPVAPAIARDLLGAMVASRADEAILISLSGFTSGVDKFARENQIKLMDLNDIIHLSQTTSTK